MAIDAQGLRAGTAEAFESVYEIHLELVLRVLRGGFAYRSASGDQRFLRVDSAYDVEELCQEVFSRFFAQCKAGTFDVTRPIQPYLRKMAMNMALRHAGKAHREILLEEPDAHAAPPQRTLEDEECARLLAEFRATLDEREDEILVGYFEEKKVSQAQLGSQLGLSRDQVYRVIQRIRSNALDFFKARGWFDEP